MDQGDRSADTGASPRDSRTLAAFLSFIVPGAGQLATGRLGAGLFFLAPFVLVALSGVLASSGDRGQLLGTLLQPDVLLAIALLDALVFVWRAAAILDAWWGGRLAPRHTALSTAMVMVLLALAGATHLAVGAQAMAVRDTVGAVFAAPDDDGDDGFGDVAEATAQPSPTPTPRPGTTPGPTPEPTPEPTPTPVPTPRPGPLADGRLDVLLVGGDAGPGRWSLRTDTLMLLSVDVRSGEAALFSIPRNLVNVPLPAESRRAFSCGCFPGYINALYVYASGHPGEFPGADEVRGLRAVQMAIGTLTGRKLDGMVVVQLQGFVKLIDAIGGLDITVPEAVFDEHYPLENGRGYVTVSIRAGKQHLTGHRALIYARSRHQDDDYGRMERQQLVVAALARQLLKEPLITRLPDLLDFAKGNLWTNLKTRDLPDLARLAEQVDVKGMQRIRFVPPTYPSTLGPASIKRIRSVVAHVFDDAVPLPEPTPTPTPTPVPSEY